VSEYEHVLGEKVPADLADETSAELVRVGEQARLSHDGWRLLRVVDRLTVGRRELYVEVRFAVLRSRAGIPDHRIRAALAELERTDRVRYEPGTGSRASRLLVAPAGYAFSEGECEGSPLDLYAALLERVAR